MISLKNILSYDLPPLGDLFVENGNSSALKIENVLASISGDDKLRVYICARSASGKKEKIKGYQGTLVVNPFTCFYLIYKGRGDMYPLPIEMINGYNVIDVYHPEPNAITLVGRRANV